jgi:hypothetical protein
MKEIKKDRNERAAEQYQNNTPARLDIRRRVQELRLTKLKRSLENET